MSIRSSFGSRQGANYLSLQSTENPPTSNDKKRPSLFFPSVCDVQSRFAVEKLLWSFGVGVVDVDNITGRQSGDDLDETANERKSRDWMMRLGDCRSEWFCIGLIPVQLLHHASKQLPETSYDIGLDFERIRLQSRVHYVFPYMTFSHTLRLPVPFVPKSEDSKNDCCCRKNP